MRLAGHCHCQNIRVTFETSESPEKTLTRACQCTFCRAHGAVTVTDPGGGLIIAVERETDLVRYRFGLRTAEFLICRRCGVYVAAICCVDGRTLATVNVNALSDRARFLRAAEPVSYDGEAAEQRLARRNARWTPATIVTRTNR